MSDLHPYPADWQETALGVLADYINGFPFKPRDWKTVGLPIVRIAQMTDPSASLDYYDDPLPSQYQIDNGDLLFSWSATLLAIIWKRGPAYVNQHIYKVIARNDNDLRFLHHLLNHLVEPMANQSHGTTMKHITRGDLIPYQVTVPFAPEQTRIATVLDMIGEAISRTESVIAKLKQVRAGLLHDLLTRGLDENGELRDPIARPEQFKASPLGTIPKGWDVASLVSRITFPQGQVDPRIAPYCDWILVAPDHVESETGRLIARQTALEQEAISGKYIFESGDVVYSKIRPYLRKAVLMQERGLCSADMYPLRPVAGVNSRFLLAVVLGEPFSRFASAVSMRSGFPKINRTELSEYIMAWPDSEEQDQIASVLTVIDGEKAAVEGELSKLLQLKSGLMADLLTGKVRVPEGMDI